MSSAEPAPAGIDPERPSAARIYDYWLGGAHNFAVDRRVAEQTIAAYPDGPLMAQANRAFLRRAVQYLVDHGIRQFLDIGSGIPTVGHVHEIAQRTAPEAKVVYVDIDPIAVAHSNDILAGNPRTCAVQHDLRKPEQILTDPEVTGLLDLGRPVAVLLVAILHYLPDGDDPAGLVARLMAPLPADSHVAISHATDDGPIDGTALADIFRRAGITMSFRTRSQVTALFGECELVPPGLVWVPQWRPESAHDLQVSQPTASGNYGGVGRKR